MGREQIFAALEGVDGGDKLVAELKTEFGEITKLAAKKGELNSQVETLSKTLQDAKPILDAIAAESLTVDGLTSLITKSRDGEDKFTTMSRNFETLQSKFDQSEKSNAEKDKLVKSQAIEKNKTKLYEAFSEKLANINPKILKPHLKLAIASDDIRFDEEGKPVGKYGDTFLNVDAYSEKFKDDNKEFIIAKTGAGSENKGTVSNNGAEGDATKKTGYEHISSKYE